MDNLGRKSVKAAYWSTLFTAGRFTLQLAAQVVLARLLGPQTYGVFAMGLVVYAFSYFLATFGFAWGLGRLKEMTDDDIRFVLTWQIVTGLVAAVSLYLSAPLIARYFLEPRVLPVVQWMSLACLMNAIAAVSSGVQARRLAFKAVGTVQMSSYAIGYLVVGIPLAYLGYGVMALVYAWLVQAASAMVLGWLLCRHPLRPRLTSPQARALFSTGGAVLLTNLGNWALSNIDRIVIGRVLAAELTGIYSVGYNLANLPFTLLVGALQPVFQSAGARMQDEPERLRSAYRMMMSAVLVLLVPAFLCGAAVANDIVLTIYGPRWAASGPVLAALLVAVPALVAWGMSTPILWNTGRTYSEFLLQLPVLALGIAALVALAPRGVVTAAWVCAGIGLLRCLVICCVAFSALGLSWRVLLPDAVRSLGFSALLVAIARGVPLALPAGTHASLRLAVALGVSAAVGLSILRYVPMCLGPGTADFLDKVVPARFRPARRAHRPPAA